MNDEDRGTTIFKLFLRFVYLIYQNQKVIKEEKYVV
ncbi:hypothetical protein J2Z37_002271 [Ammoniphilus resinae]|uniref:Uncharacterized protein n=1 Tax=Ammoniphilus resinae TaxID=861532 RepID=A0ABS4GPS4_9BACL|nr:hypothetical protein [Ammoniphilus resinae]